MELELNYLAHVIKQKSQYAVKRHWLPQLLQKVAWGFFTMHLNLNLPSDLLSDHSRYTSFKLILHWRGLAIVINGGFV